MRRQKELRMNLHPTLHTCALQCNSAATQSNVNVKPLLATQGRLPTNNKKTQNSTSIFEERLSSATNKLCSSQALRARVKVGSLGPGLIKNLE